MGLLWKNELTLDNFEDFATEHIKPTYLMAYKATLSATQASNLSVAALCKVFSLREVYAEDSQNIVPEKAIADALEAMLTKIQFTNLHSSSISPTEADLPSTEELISLVDKAVDKARAEMPRYAPVYSGTTGVLLIMTMVVVIVAAIALITLNPFAKKDTSAEDTAKTLYVDSAAHVDPEYMIDMSANIHQASEDGFIFNNGALPVTLEINGPDAKNTAFVSATDSNGIDIKIYQYDLQKYCYITCGEGVYRSAAKSVDGREHSVYTGVYDIPTFSVSPSDLVPPNIYVAVSHGQQITIDLFNADMLDSVAIADKSQDSAVSSSDAEAQLTILPPISGTLEFSDDNGSLLYTADSTVGLDRIILDFDNNDGTAAQLAIPVIVCNAPPVIDSSSLNAELMHTPSHQAVSVGRITASDADGDKVTFKLVDTVNCSVLLAPNGGYIASIDKDYTGSFASFSYTATDGLVTTDIVTVTFSLKNQLIDQVEYSQDFTCYAGEYYYVLNLPKNDLDGDKLEWTVVTPLNNGLTPNGSEVVVSEDGTIVSYRISPELNENNIELINLVCSDGWAQSPTINFICNITENRPPVSGGGNSVTIPLGQAEVTCTLNIKDDFELDKCVISGVHSAVGGSVDADTGWNELTFTFRPDGSETDCYVLLNVTDTLSNQSSVIRYTIVRD